MGALTKHLTMEHVQIVKILDLLQEFPFKQEEEKNRGFLKSILSALQILLGGIHHEKEERILFPALHKDSALRQGGPRCGLYMTHLLLNNTGRQFVEIGKRRGYPNPEMSDDLLAIREANSPLTIPLEEHHGGLTAIRLLTEMLNDDATNETDFIVMAIKFEQMMRLHIEKEDTCLFVLADQLIDEKMQEQLHENILAIDRRHQEDLEKVKSLLQQLPRRVKYA